MAAAAFRRARPLPPSASLAAWSALLPLLLLAGCCAREANAQESDALAPTPTPMWMASPSADAGDGDGDGTGLTLDACLQDGDCSETRRCVVADATAAAAAVSCRLTSPACVCVPSRLADAPPCAGSSACTPGERCARVVVPAVTLCVSCNTSVPHVPVDGPASCAREALPTPTPPAAPDEGEPDGEGGVVPSPAATVTVVPVPAPGSDGDTDDDDDEDEDEDEGDGDDGEGMGGRGVANGPAPSVPGADDEDRDDALPSVAPLASVTPLPLASPTRTPKVRRSPEAGATRPPRMSRRPVFSPEDPAGVPLPFTAEPDVFDDDDDDEEEEEEEEGAFPRPSMTMTEEPVVSPSVEEPVSPLPLPSLSPSPSASASALPTDGMIFPSPSADADADAEADDVLPAPSSENAAEGEETEVCVDARALAQHLPADALVYRAPRRASVLCDAHGSCATPGHVVVYDGVPMLMSSYCALLRDARPAAVAAARQQSQSARAATAAAAPPGSGSPCVRRVMLVNSPRFRRALRVPAANPRLFFTAHAARFATALEEAVLAVAVRAGL